jgi:hypothetical protein
MVAPTTAGVLDLRVQRWQPFDDTIDIEGVDMTGVTLSMQVRAYRDAPGAALLDLGTVSPTGQGLSVSVATVDGAPVSTIRILINETTIEGLLPFPANGVEPGADVTLQYAIIISGIGFRKARWFEGAFTIIPGANQA